MNFSYKRTTEDKVVIKGVLSDDATMVVVTEKDEEKKVIIQDYLNKFAGDYIEITLKNKSEDDLLDSKDE